MYSDETCNSFSTGVYKRVLIAGIIVTLCVAIGVSSGVAIGDSVTTQQSVNISPENESDSGSFDTTTSDDEFREPDISLPRNDFIVFYSEKENIDLGDTEESVETTHPEVSSTGTLSLLDDTEYRTTEGLFSVYGWTFGEYRGNQLLGHAWTLDESYQLGGYDDTQSDGMIQDAYVKPVGVHGGAEPDFRWFDDNSYDHDAMVGNTGSLLTYTDFYIDRDEAESDSIDDPSEQRRTDDPKDTDRTDSLGDLRNQTQSRDTRHAENYSVETQALLEGDGFFTTLGSITYEGNSAEIRDESNADVQETTVDESLGEVSQAGGQNTSIEGLPGRSIFEYNHTEGGSEMNFWMRSDIEVERGHYEWERERERVYDSTYEEISGSATTSGWASTYATADNENTTAASGRCRTDERQTEEIRASETHEIEELNGDRVFDVERSATFEISGRPSGTCEGHVSEPGGRDRIYDTVEGTISGSTTEEFKYDYWDHWNSDDNSDDGGWEIQSRTVEETDEVRVEEVYDVYNTDNNDVDVRQVAVEADESTYHTIVDIDYAYDDPFTRNQMEDMYYWSLLTFGSDTFVESAWGAYSTTQFGGENTPMTGYDTTERTGDFPRQLGVNVFSSTSNPELVTGLERATRTPELYGWDGFKADYNEESQPGTDDRTTHDDGVPVFTDTVVVKDAPEPASELVSIHGDTVEIEEDDTDIIPYAEPEVSIELDAGGDTATTTVTGVDNEPLVGRTVVLENGVEEPGEEVTTNEDGEVTYNVSDGVSYVQLTVEGDDINDLLDDPDRDVFYGSVFVERSLGGLSHGFEGVVGYMADLVIQFLVAGPLVLYYLFWRDTRLAE